MIEISKNLDNFYFNIKIPVSLFLDVSNVTHTHFNKNYHI